MPVDERRPSRNTEIAIQNGYAEILRMLLEHNAFVSYHAIEPCGTALNLLLSDYWRSFGRSFEEKNSPFVEF
jgi:hypothetical protein